MFVPTKEADLKSLKKLLISSLGPSAELLLHSQFDSSLFKKLPMSLRKNEKRQHRQQPAAVCVSNPTLQLAEPKSYYQNIIAWLNTASRKLAIENSHNKSYLLWLLWSSCCHGSRGYFGREADCNKEGRFAWEHVINVLQEWWWMLIVWVMPAEVKRAFHFVCCCHLSAWPLNITSDLSNLHLLFLS